MLHPGARAKCPPVWDVCSGQGLDLLIEGAKRKKGAHCTPSG